MAHAQKPDFIFRRNGRVHLNQRGRQFGRLLAAEVCAWAVVMLNKPCSGVVWRVLATHSIRQFPLHFPSLRHRVPSHFNWTLLSLEMDLASPNMCVIGRRCKILTLHAIGDVWVKEHGALVEWYWQGRPKRSKKPHSQCQFLYHKSYKELSGIEAGPPRWQHSEYDMA